MSECYQLRVWGKGRKAIARCMWGGGPHQGSSRHQVSQQTLGQAVRLGRKRNPGREGNWPWVAAGYIYPTSLFPANQSMVSAPTEVSGSFSESKILCSGECVCVLGRWRGRAARVAMMLREGQAIVPKYFRSHRFPKDPQTTNPGPSQGPSADTEAQAGQWSSECLRQSRPPLPSLPDQVLHRDPHPETPTGISPCPGALGPRNNVKIPTVDQRK